MGGTIAQEIKFINVLAHCFETELVGSVIFDIIQINIDDFFSENKEFLELKKIYCWPINYDTTEELIVYLKSNQYNYYKIEPSYGLSGWIIAKEQEIK